MEINKDELEQTIVDVSKRRLKIHHKRQHSYLAKVKRLNRASQNPILFKNFKKPSYWKESRFNPVYVSKHSKYFAKVISYKIQDNKFEFSPPRYKIIKKDDGSNREISIFPINDEAVSLYFFTKLMRKNSYIFSNHSYAYQSNNSPHNAAQYITREFAKYHRLYIAEFDFSKYFDSINHKYLLQMINSGKYHITKSEIFVIEKFLEKSKNKENNQGIPQGSALSLFLANVALEELDSLLETLNLSFVRFADDILIWSKSYEALNNCVEYIFQWSEKSLVNINIKKSHGIRILSKIDGVKTEIESTSSVSFLGFNFYLGKTTFSDKKISEIKKHINQIIYIHLLKNPLNSKQKMDRISGDYDKDYMALIFELRRFIYGDLSNAKVNYLFRTKNLPEVPLNGFLPYYVSINDEQTFKDLDSFTITQIYLALRKRKLLITQRHPSSPRPLIWNADIKELNKMDFKISKGDLLSAEIPSFSKYHKLINKSIKFYGADILKFDRNIESVIRFY